MPCYESALAARPDPKATSIIRKSSLPSYQIKICFTYVHSSLRVAETVWMEGVFLKEFPPEVSAPKGFFFQFDTCFHLLEPHTNICPTIYSLYCETVVKLSCVLSDYRAFTKFTIKIGQTPKLAKRLCGGSSSAINIVLPEQGTQQLCCIATTITQHPVRASLT